MKPAAEPQVLDRYECLVCGYAYEPTQGDSKHEVSPGTPLQNCPLLGAVQFVVLGLLSSRTLAP